MTEGAARRLGRPKDVVSAETQERILQVARIEFARRGYDGTTNRHIAEAAGITPGAIYHYFPSKAHLFLAVYEQVQAVVYGEFEKAAASHETLIARFSAVLDRAVELNREDPSIGGFVVGVGIEAQRHTEIRQLAIERRSVNTVFVRRLASDAAARGELADGVPVKAVEDLLNAIVGGLTHFSYQTGDPIRHARAIDALKRFMTGTLVR
ncbi:MAG: TetR/AcrR family transcriptional regulator [Ilumatobacteraceae bacterium]|jgi:AcrR family transcriptional regulator